MGKPVAFTKNEEALVNKPVSVSDLHYAIEWLLMNDAHEEDDDEGWACIRVVRFLYAEIARREDRAVIRAAAKKLGVPERVIRRHRNAHR